MNTVTDEPNIRNGRREQRLRANACPHCESLDTIVGRTMTSGERYCYCRNPNCPGIRYGRRLGWKQTPKG